MERSSNYTVYWAQIRAVKGSLMGSLTFHSWNVSLVPDTVTALSTR